MAGRLLPFEHPFFQRQRSWGWEDPWSHAADLSPPPRLFDQYFGLPVSERELLPPSPFGGWYVRPKRTEPPAKTTGVSEVALDKSEFRVNLDVTHFKPEEIHVKTTDDRIVVDASHEERPDEHGFIQRSFRRSYIMPKDIDPMLLRSSLSADGILTISAPKRLPDTNKERAIPIEKTPPSSGQDEKQPDTATA